MFGSAVTATGTSPIGTSVQASASARFAVFGFEFLQAQLTGAKGEVPAVVRGSLGLDPRTIDVASIRIDGVGPIRPQLAPRGGDWDLLL